MTREIGADSAVPSSDGDAPTRIVAVDTVGRGMVLAGKYEVERVLGQGGMGVVVAAKSITTGGPVALKFLLNDAAKDPEAVERFQREARAASQIPNEHVTRVLDTGYLDSGAPFIVMELLLGKDLGQVIDQSKRLPIPTAIDYVLQALEAIGAAHLLGIVHRDIKPANLFLTQDASGQPLVKVLDFGLSKDLGSRDGFSLTQTSTGAMGTPLYMAPEQVKSAKHATFSSDIWSVGVVIHELVSGDIPFDGGNLGALLGAILAEPPKPLRASLPSAPAGLEAAVLACLEKDQRRRPRDILDLARSIAPYGTAAGARSTENLRLAYERAGYSTAARNEGRATLQSMVADGATADEPRARPRWAFTSDPAKQRRRGALAASGVFALALIGVTTFVVRARLAATERASSDAAAVASAPPPAASATPPSTSPVEPSVTVEPVSSAAPAMPPTAEPSASGPKARPSSGPASKATASPPPPPPPKPSAASPSLDELLKRGRR